MMKLCTSLSWRRSSEDSDDVLQENKNKTRCNTSQIPLNEWMDGLEKIRVLMASKQESKGLLLLFLEFLDSNCLNKKRKEKKRKGNKFLVRLR